MSFRHIIGSLSEEVKTKQITSDNALALRILDRCLPHQRDFVLDTARMRSALCPRRAGKTFACAALIAHTALKKPGAKIVYLCLTSGQAADNLWGYLKKFSSDFELGLKFNETKLRAKFPNGTTVQLAGAETRKEIDKLRGGAFGLDLVVIDECKSFQERVLSELIWEVLKPALSDRLGSLVVIGTPGNILSGPFYEATVTDKPHERAPTVRYWPSRSEHKGKFTWSFHSWTSKQNTAMPQIWADAVRLKEERGLLDEDPIWLREYLGQWCPSDSLLVYRYADGRNSWVPDNESQFGLPSGHVWKYVLGMDIGFNDSTAIVVAAYSDTNPNLYHVYDFKQPHLSVDSIEKAVRETIARFGDFEGMVADTGGLGKTVVATLNERGLYFEAAEKREKYDHIELVNSDLLSGRIKVLSDSYLASEMALLQWEDSTYKKEDKSTDNHACDAFLYLWRYAHHHLWTPAKVEVKRDSVAWFEQLDTQAAEARVMRRKTSGLDSLGLDADIDADIEEFWIH